MDPIDIDAARDFICWHLAETYPEMSASRLTTRGQVIAAAVLVVIAAALIALWPVAIFQVLFIATTAFLTMAVAAKVVLTVVAFCTHGGIRVGAGELDSIPDADLPVYTVLLPVYREAAMITGLVQAMKDMDYPKDKLDAKLLVEEDDRATLAAIAAQQLPRFIEKLVVPSGLPRGKPKACNYGLLFARGEYCVLYDAEDRPERDQLKQAAAAFARLGPRVACIQAKLSYHNAGQNLLTKWFTAEYATWFELYLPSLTGLRVPFPLGGTSNHFRTETLRAVAAWDPFNVTEDADLGIRLGRLGYRTAVLDSTTFEEAPSQLGNWVRQRSRWVKGFVLTWLVHMRNPFKLWRQAGTGGFIAFQAMIFGTFFVLLSLLPLWCLAAVSVAFPSLVRDFMPSLALRSFGTELHFNQTVFLTVNVAFCYLAMAGVIKRRKAHLLIYAPLMPVYWFLMSVAAYKGIIQLVTKPYYWEKTDHGHATPPLTAEVSLATE
jgi:cellulose synthase/poly-beta-1,6-N-acetylglucosamine synthase-like glycosyltransferase